MKRLRQLEDENGELKNLLAEPMLDALTLKEMLGLLATSLRKRAVTWRRMAP
jgi:hypothetical protein